MHGATLSGCPSSAAVSCRSMLRALDVVTSCPRSAIPAAMPATSAPDDDPMPRAGGMRLTHTNSIHPIGSFILSVATVLSYPRLTIATTPFVASRGRLSTPSPRSVTCGSLVNGSIPSKVSTSVRQRTHTSLRTSSAMPSVSNPGPMFALVAGTVRCHSSSSGRFSAAASGRAVICAYLSSSTTHTADGVADVTANRPFVAIFRGFLWVAPLPAFPHEPKCAPECPRIAAAAAASHLPFLLRCNNRLGLHLGDDGDIIKFTT
mmetsp:Transcript_4129/g.10755  ORF Transcript_4129/g.10755 Transcript_4129/m.10755 type:complete len:262 (+) Transcript_4129:741-1526(+)